MPPHPCLLFCVCVCVCVSVCITSITKHAHTHTHCSTKVRVMRSFEWPSTAAEVQVNFQVQVLDCQRVRESV